MYLPENESSKHGTFFYSTAIDKFYGKLTERLAYEAKSKLIQQTADDLRSALRRTPLNDVICIARHTYDLSDSFRDDGSTKEPML